MSITGERIKELRIAKGYSQEKLGDLLGVQKSVIAKYERGAVENLKRSTIEKMSLIFGVRPCYLMGFTDEPLNTIQERIVTVLEEMSQEGQEKVLEYAQLLSGSEQYKKRYKAVVG